MKNSYHKPMVSAFFAIFLLIGANLTLSAQSISISFAVSNYLEVYNIASCHGSFKRVCSGQAINGGTAPYTLLWNTGDTISNQPPISPRAGTYILSVTDSLGATATDTAVLSEPNALNVLLSSPLCHSSPDYNICNPGTNSGTIYSTVTGGAGGYTYNWNTGDQYATLTNAPAGNYTLAVTDNNSCIGYRTYYSP